MGGDYSQATPNMRSTNPQSHHFSLKPYDTHMSYISPRVAQMILHMVSRTIRRRRLPPPVEIRWTTIACLISSQNQIRGGVPFF